MQSQRIEQVYHNTCGVKISSFMKLSHNILRQLSNTTFITINKKLEAMRIKAISTRSNSKGRGKDLKTKSNDNKNKEEREQQSNDKKRID